MSEYEKPSGQLLTALISSAMDGDERALENLLTAYASQILIFCRNMTENDQDAEDAAQKVAVAVWQGIGKLDSPYTFSSWLRRVMVNICADEYRNAKRPAQRETGIEYAEYVCDDNAENIPEESVSRSDAGAALHSLIMRLPASQRQALYLYYYEDIPYKDIAKLLGVRSGTVGTNIKKAKKNLMDMIERDIPAKESILGIGKFAFAPLIANAFHADAERYLTETVLRKFSEQITAAPSFGPSNAADTPNHFQGGDGKTFWSAFGISAVGLGVAAAVTVALIHQSPAEIPEKSEIPADTAPAPVAEPVSVADAKIDFETYSDIGPNVDPVSASLALSVSEGVNIKGYSIIDESGGEVAAGQGAYARVPQGLEPGKYSVTWNVSSAGAAFSEIKRDFYISAER
jgi:RNA polymerase sigma-70 factor (ECF subfamily)